MGLQVILAKIIGLSGQIESGKDTVASILREYGYVQVSYGKHIREEAGHGYIPIGWIPDNIKRTVQTLRDKPNLRDLVWAKPTTPEIRALLQWWGQWRLHQDGNYWTDRLAAEIQGLPQGSGRVLVSDVRLPPEYYFVSRMGGENWKIDRITDESKEHSLHITEMALRHYKFDAVIDNNVNLDRLTHNVSMALSYYDPSATRIVAP